MATTSARRNQSQARNGIRTQAISDFDEIITKAQDMVKATADAGGEQVDELRHGIERQLKLAKTHLEDLEDNLADGARGADRYVHENPWPLIGAAAGIGILVGVLVARK